MKRCYYLLLAAAAVLRGQVPTDAEIRSILYVESPLAPACAAARRAVSTRNGEQET